MEVGDGDLPEPGPDQIALTKPSCSTPPFLASVSGVRCSGTPSPWKCFVEADASGVVIEQLVQDSVQRALAVGLDSIINTLDHHQSDMLAFVDTQQNIFLAAVEKLIRDWETRWAGGSQEATDSHASFSNSRAERKTSVDSIVAAAQQLRNFQQRKGPPRRRLPHIDNRRHRTAGCELGDSSRWTGTSPARSTSSELEELQQKTAEFGDSGRQSGSPPAGARGSDAPASSAAQQPGAEQDQELEELQQKTAELGDGGRQSGSLPAGSQSSDVPASSVAQQPRAEQDALPHYTGERYTNESEVISETLSDETVSSGSFVDPTPVSGVYDRPDIPRRCSILPGATDRTDSDIAPEPEPAWPDMPEHAARPEVRQHTGHQMGVEQLRKERESSIILKFSTETEVVHVAGTPETCMMCWLRLTHLFLVLSGIFPGYYGRFVIAVCYAVLFYSVYTVAVEGFNILSIVCVCYALGGGVGLHLLRMKKIHGLVGSSERLLEKYAIHHQFLDAWTSASLRLSALIGLLVASNELEFGASCNDRATLSGLELMVDTYCIKVIGESDFNQGVVTWNVLQAVMRRAAETIDLSFLLVQTSTFTATVLIGIGAMLGFRSSEDVFRSMPSSLVMAAVMLVGQYRAAAVTEKCLRVPALMNSLVVQGHPINGALEFLVQFITQSAAGFYVRGVRLTAFMVLKGAYVCVMVVVGLAMRLSTSASMPMGK